MSVLDNVEHRAERAEVWVAEASGAAVAAVTPTFAGEPYSEIAMENELEFRMLAVDTGLQGGGVGRAVVRQVIEHAQSLPAIRAISITSATFMDRAHVLYESLGFERDQMRDWVRARRGRTAVSFPARAGIYRCSPSYAATSWPARRELTSDG